MEVIEAIDGLKLGFAEGNTLKYLARWPEKGGVKDLRKAAWYVHHLIDQQADGREQLTQMVCDVLADLFPNVDTAQIAARLHEWEQNNWEQGEQA